MQDEDPIRSVPPVAAIRERIEQLKGELRCLRDLRKVAERAHAQTDPAKRDQGGHGDR